MKKLNRQIVEELQEDNEKIRGELDKLIGIEHPLYSPIWSKIGELIENEIEQEEYSNE